MFLVNETEFTQVLKVWNEKLGSFVKLTVEPNSSCDFSLYENQVHVVEHLAPLLKVVDKLPEPAAEESMADKMAKVRAAKKKSE